MIPVPCAKARGAKKGKELGKVLGDEGSPNRRRSPYFRCLSTVTSGAPRDDRRYLPGNPGRRYCGRSGSGVGGAEMKDLDQRIAQLQDELKRLEAEMQRAGLAVTPELARVRRWELGRCVASLYQRWHDFLLLHHAPSSTAYRNLGRHWAHAPRPD